MDEHDIRRAVVRIAHEIVEHNHGCQDLVLIGIRKRGVPLADRIARSIEDFESKRIPVGTLDIGLHRDDLMTRGAQVEIRPSDIPTDIFDRRLVIVDDVLFTGRSIRAALDALVDYGRPQRIQLAVLIDRGHRELPIRADYVGKNIPTSVQDEVDVHLVETDGEDGVIVTRLGGGEVC